MLSRIADAQYWMMRYTERTSGILRILRINFITSLDRTDDYSWKPILHVYTRLNDAEKEAMSHRGDEVLRYMISHRENPYALRNVVAQARENARGMQDHVTKEVWECLNGLYHKVNSNELEKAIERGEQIIFLSNLADHCFLFNGVTDATMPRGEGWHYMNLGKFIERAIQTMDMLDVRFSAIDYDLGSTTNIPYWRNLLLTLSGYEMYLKRYRGGFQGRNVADMAILNPEFPRSVMYCLHRIEQIINNLSHENVGGTPQLQKQIGRLRAKVEFVEIDQFTSAQLKDFLTETKKDFYQLSSTLGQTYFAYQ